MNLHNKPSRYSEIGMIEHIAVIKDLDEAMRVPAQNILVDNNNLNPYYKC